MKKKTKNIIIGVSIILLLVSIGYFATKQDIYDLNKVYSIDTYLISKVSSTCSCNPSSPYDKQIGDYSTKINVGFLPANSESGKEQYYSNDEFTWDRGFRCDTREYYVLGTNRIETLPDFLQPTKYLISDGIEPQIRCDGTKDCNFGYTSEKWELNGNKCYIKSPITPVETPSETPNETPTETPEENKTTTQIIVEKIPVVGNIIYPDTQEIESTPIYLYLIPVSIIGLVAFIIYQRRKKPRRKK